MRSPYMWDLCMIQPGTCLGQAAIANACRLAAALRHILASGRGIPASGKGGPRVAICYQPALPRAAELSSAQAQPAAALGWRCSLVQAGLDSGTVGRGAIPVPDEPEQDPCLQQSGGQAARGKARWHPWTIPQLPVGRAQQRKQHTPSDWCQYRLALPPAQVLCSTCGVAHKRCSHCEDLCH